MCGAWVCEVIGCERWALFVFPTIGARHLPVRDMLGCVKYLCLCRKRRLRNCILGLKDYRQQCSSGKKNWSRGEPGVSAPAGLHGPW